MEEWKRAEGENLHRNSILGRRILGLGNKIDKHCKSSVIGAWNCGV